MVRFTLKIVPNLDPHNGHAALFTLLCQFHNFTVMAVSMLALVSCGGEKEDLSDSKYVGTWKISKMSLADESEDFDEDWTLEIKGDGTGKSIAKDETDDFTWKPVDGGFKTKGDIKLTFKDDGDNIVGSLFGVKLIFERVE